MRKGIFGSLACWLTAAGLALAEGEAMLPQTEPAPSCSISCFEPRVDPCGGCAPARPCWWIGADYLMWWFKDQGVPQPLITTGPVAGGGALGNAGTGRVDPLAYNYGIASGIRLNAGRWLGDDRTFGVDTSSFLFQRTSNSFAAFDPSGSTLIAQPFINVGGNGGAIPASSPNLFGGGVGIATGNRFWGSEINMIHARPTTRDGLSVTTLLGFRYVDLTESLLVLSPAVNLAGSPPAGAFSEFSDFFGTRNQFYGGQVGARFDYQLDRFFVNGFAKLALGSTHQTSSINGSFLFQAPGAAPTITSGGVLTGTTNIGRFTQDEFAVIPELQLNVGYQLRPRLRTYVGYNFIYWSDVLRPGDQIDLGVGGGHPLVLMNRSDFWAHGLSFGAEFRY